MEHIVETVLAERGLVDNMNQMRIWLDHMKFQAGEFRCTPKEGKTVYRINFASESEAHAFAAAFGGVVSKMGVGALPIL
jgi:hypothetical protein